ncbi:MAG: NupC/NupG family nucleoside CNT transporter [Planctomycetota bacterium]
MLRLLSLLGLVCIVGLCYLLSRNRRAVSFRLVGGGLAIQAALGAVFLYWDQGNLFLRGLGDFVRDFLAMANAGISFVFGPLAEAGPIPGSNLELGFILATQVLPLLIFFSSLMAVLYHLGLMQMLVRGMAIVMARLLGTSGAESLSACGNIFVGPTEAPLMVRPFLARMTESELHAVMTGGFATIAGTVFAVYVAFGIDPGFLIVASVMAAPAGIVCSKLICPETEQSETMGRVTVEIERTAGNVVEAAANGASDGLKLALNVGAMLVAFLGLVAIIDWGLAGVGGWLDYPELSLSRILGWLFYPLAAVMGVPAGEVLVLSELLGTKIAVTELVSFRQLGEMGEQVSERTRLVASFALCGFASVGTAAIQIGGLGALAPERRADIARLAFRAMFTGALASCMTACLAGALSDV